VTIEPNDRMDILVIPSLRYNAETGADLSDGQTFGVLAGVAWQINDNLWIGPGVGWFSALEDSDSVFPVLLIEWEFADNWSLSTGEGFGATQGPGLTLNWQATDAWRIGLTARYEKVRFRLDDSGPAPGGVGEDESIPIVLGASWEPNPGMRFSAFAGVQTGGKVRLYDRGGTEIERSDYDTAPLFGMTARFRF
jgi:long-subunit fatty acid transport protein